MLPYLTNPGVRLVQERPHRRSKQCVRLASLSDRSEQLARLEQARKAHAVRAQKLQACYGVSFRQTGNTLSGRLRVLNPAGGADTTLGRLGPILGEGATARVYLSTFGSDRCEVAAKVVIKSRISQQELQWVRTEAGILGMLHHANICRLHGLTESPQR